MWSYDMFLEDDIDDDDNDKDVNNGVDLPKPPMCPPQKQAKASTRNEWIAAQAMVIQKERSVGVAVVVTFWKEISTACGLDSLRPSTPQNRS